MNVLLVYPEFMDSFWSFRYALKFVGKKAAMPPVGLLTIAGLLPEEWHRKLVDLNVEPLEYSLVEWADMVMISAMNAQKKSAERTISSLLDAGVTIVAGGPLFSNEPLLWEKSVDHIFIGESEHTFPAFLKDLEAGNTKKTYESSIYPNLEETPVPDWSLIDTRNYNTLGIQFSRGCPHNCDFCNITALFGKRVRTKSVDQIITELDAITATGWKGGVFFVDDNFIGNRSYLKNTLLPKLILWRKKHRAITFQTETSILIADDDQLMTMMASSGFNTLFIGIETTDEESLKGCGKIQNTGRNLLEDVRKIQRRGFEVEAGFIVGFDNDGASVFESQWKFIQRSGIVTAMVAMLQAPEGTDLYRRLKSEGRISGEVTDGTDGTTNVVPVMGISALSDGYRDLVSRLYTPGAFYSRIKCFLDEFQPAGNLAREMSFRHLMAVPKSVFRLGILGRERYEYWKLAFWTFFKHPRLIPLALRLAIYGHHFSKTIEAERSSALTADAILCKAKT